MLRRGGPGVQTVGAWVGQRLNLGTARAPRACRVRCSPNRPKLGFEYLPTYKTLHYACSATRAHKVCGSLAILRKELNTSAPSSSRPNVHTHLALVDTVSLAHHCQKAQGMYRRTVMAGGSGKKAHQETARG